MNDSALPRLSVFGLGYVGAVNAACLAARGHRVIGVDVAPAKVEAVAAGRPPITEPGLEAILAEAVAAGRLSATCYAEPAVRGSDVSLVCVGTPPAPDGAPDLRFVRKVFAEICELVRAAGKPHAVILRSTLLPGTTASLVREFAADLVAAGRLEVFFLPEFLREGSAVEDFRSPSLHVVGGRDAALPGPGLCDTLLAGATPLDWATAEMVKYACNSFHAAKVAFANEIGRIAAAGGVDGRAVMRLLCADTRLNISPAYLRPGNPFGGSCLPKDLRALLQHARQAGVEASLLESLLPSNTAHLEHLLGRIARAGQEEIVILGFSFKAGTDDLRESPMVDVAQALLARGYRLRLFDPQVHPERFLGGNRLVADARLPQLATLLKPTLAEALGRRGLVVAAQPCATLDELRAVLTRDHALLDVNGWPELAGLGVPYQGLCW